MMMQKKSYKALWHTSPQESQIDKKSFDSPTSHYDDEGMVLVKSDYSLISTGTERLVAMGQVPDALHKSMMVPYMEGNFTLPIKYGYSLTGTVVTGNKAWVGKKVHLLHPHQDYAWVRANSLFEIPEGVTAKRASLVSNVETALTAIWDAQIALGDRVLVVGFGIIGALVAELLRQMPAVNVQVAEIDPFRRRMAQNMGFDLLDSYTAQHPATQKKNHLLFDVAFNTSINDKGLQLAIDQVGFEGKVIELSWYGKAAVQVQLGGSFHSQRKQIIASQVGRLPATHQTRWDFKRRKQVVFELLKNPIFDQYITHTLPFASLPDFFAQLRNRKVKGLGYCVAY